MRHCQIQRNFLNIGDLWKLGE